MTIDDLAALVRQNPACIFMVDNDCWWMQREPEDNNPFDGDSEDEDELNQYDNWSINNIICESDDIAYYSNDYGSGSSHGGDILQALAKIVGVTVESV